MNLIQGIKVVRRIVKARRRISHVELVGELEKMGVFRVDVMKIIKACVRDEVIVSLKRPREGARGPRVVKYYMLRRKFG